jgi:hypothetical protein
MRSVPAKSTAALERLIQIAEGDTGQSRIVANFLLAWWNAGECGGFDLTDVWGVDTSIAVDMLRVFALMAGCLSAAVEKGTKMAAMAATGSRVLSEGAFPSSL